MFWFFFLTLFWILSDATRTLLLHRQVSKEWSACLLFLFGVLWTIIKEHPDNALGTVDDLILKKKKNPVNKWLHQPPQIRSNKTRYIYAVAELRAICCDLLTAIYIYTDPKYFGNRNCPFYQNPTLFSSSFHFPDPHSERWREVLWWARRAKPLVCIALVGKCSRDWELWGSLLWKCGYQGENHVLGWSRLH